MQEMKEERKAPIYHWRKLTFKGKKNSSQLAATELGVDESTLWRWENYKALPSADAAERIGKRTNQTVGAVIDDYLTRMRAAEKPATLKRRSA